MNSPLQPTMEDATATPKKNEWPIFISYRRSDATRKIALELKKELEASTIEATTGQTFALDVFVDVAEAHQSDFQANLAPHLQQSRALIVLADEGAAARKSDGTEDYLYAELDWWADKRKKTPPIILQITPKAGARLVSDPQFITWRKVSFMDCFWEKWDNGGDDGKAEKRQLLEWLRGSIRNYGIIRQLEEVRRLKRRALAAFLLGVAALIAAGLAFMQKEQAERARSRAQKSEQQIRRSNGQTYFQNASAALRRDEGDLALAHLARAVRVDPENIPAKSRLVTLLGQRSWPLVVRRFVTEEAVDGILFHPDRRRIVIGSSLDAYEADGISTAQVRDIQTGRVLARPDSVARNSLDQLVLSADGSTYAIGRTHKSFSSTLVFPLPPVEGGGLGVDASAPTHSTYNHLRLRALAPSGRFAVAELGATELALLARCAPAVEEPPLELLIRFGKEETQDPDEPKPRAAVVRFPSIDSLGAVSAVGCSDLEVLLLANDGELWKIELATRKLSAAGTVLSKAGAAPAYAAFSNRGDRLAVLFEDQEIQLVDAAEVKIIAAADQAAEAQVASELADTKAKTDRAQRANEAFERIAEASRSTKDTTEIKSFDDISRILSDARQASWNGKQGTVSFTPNDLGIEFYAADTGEEGKEEKLHGGWWTVEEDADKREIKWHELPRGSMLAGGGHVAIVCENTFVRLLDPHSGIPICGVARHESMVTTAAALDDTLFGTGTVRGQVRIWTRLPQTLVAPERQQKPESVLQESENSKVLALASNVRILGSGSTARLDAKLQRGSKAIELTAPDWDGFRSANFSPDGQSFVMTGALGLDGSTRGASNEGAMIFSSIDGSPISRRFDHKSCWWAGFDPSGSKLATTGQGHVQFWNTTTGNLETVKLEHEGVSHALWNPADPNRMLTISEGNSLKMWDLPKVGVIREVPWPAQLGDQEGGGHQVSWVAFDDAGKQFAMVVNDRLMLLDAESLEPLLDPIPAPELPPNATFNNAFSMLSWPELSAPADPATLALLAEAAETIAGQRIAEDGTLEGLDDLPSALNSLASNAEKAASHPLSAFVQKLLARPELTAVRNTKPSALMESEANMKALMLLQAAAENFAGFFSNEESSPWWLLNRERLEELQNSCDEARKLAPDSASKWIAGMMNDWQRRSDPAAVLTRWHFNQGNEANRKSARKALADALSAIENNYPPESDEDKEKLFRWKAAWESALK